MAKGDRKEYSNALASKSALTQNIATTASKNVMAMQPAFQKNYNDAVSTQNADYADLMGQYKNAANDPHTAQRTGYQGMIDAKSSARGAYQDFANTGGFSPLDIQNIRNRSMGGAKGVYGVGMDEMNRAAAHNAGGNIPGAIARMTRQGAEQIGNMSTNAEADIAGMRQSGRLAGAAGLAGADQFELASHGAGLAGLGGLDQQRLAALSGATNLYNATPGMVGTFGQQALTNAGQGLQAAGLQNDVSNSYLQNLQSKYNIPTDSAQKWGKIGTGLKIAGRIGAGVMTGGASELGTQGFNIGKNMITSKNNPIKPPR